MTRKPVLSQEAPQPSGGYSQGIVAGGFLYLSGQGPYDATGDARRRRRSPSRCGRCWRTSTRSRAPPAARCATRCGAGCTSATWRTSTRWTPSTGAFFYEPDAGADDDPVGSRRLRRRGRRGRLARRLSVGASTVARHAGRDGRSGRGRAQHRPDAGLLRRARPRVPAAHQDAQAAGDRAHAGARGRGRDHVPEARRGRGDGGRRAARHPADVPARRRREGRAARGARRRGATSRSSATRPRSPAGSRRRSPRAGAEVGFLVEVDTGFARTGVQTPEDAAELAALADSLPGPALRRPDDLPDAAGHGPEAARRDRGDPRARARGAHGERRRHADVLHEPRGAGGDRGARRHVRLRRPLLHRRRHASRSRTARCGSARPSSAGRRPTARSSTAARRR